MKILVVSAEKDVGRSGGQFIRMNIIDEEKVSKNVTCFEDVDPSLLVGKVCEVTLKMQEKYPPKITSIKVLDDGDPSAFCRHTEVDRDEAVNYLKGSTRGNEVLSKVVDGILFENKNVMARFRTWPAAYGMHHAFDGGLLEHTYSMALVADATLTHDVSARGLDRDIVMCSIVLHDVGKVLEYDWTVPGPAVRSVRGILLGHISMMDELIVRECVKNELYSTKNPVLHLRHCLLSHHGNLEWGSPTKPSTREAVLVHHIDLGQSRLQIAKEATLGIEMGGYDYSKPLGTNIVHF